MGAQDALFARFYAFERTSQCFFGNEGFLGSESVMLLRGTRDTHVAKQGGCHGHWSPKKKAPFTGGDDRLPVYPSFQTLFHSVRREGLAFFRQDTEEGSVGMALFNCTTDAISSKLYPPMSLMATTVC